MHLKRLRALRGLTQKDLADMVGFTQATISMAENGHRSAKLATYQKCAAALGVTLADIFAADLSPVEARLLEVFRRIPEDQRERVVALLAIAEAHPVAEAQETRPSDTGQA